MATRKVKLRGLGYWGKVFESNRDLTGYEDALKDVGGQTSIDMDLDDNNMAKLKQSKSMKRGTPSPDNEGLTRVKLSRKWQSPFEHLGGPPVVIKADGTPWDLDIDGFIGNGSDVEVVLSVYDTSRKNIVGTRLDKVIVHKQVVYNPDAEDTPPAKEQPKTKPKVQDDVEDEIPF